MSPATDNNTTAFSPQRRSALHRRLLRWYARHGRQLPWRDADDAGADEAYAVLVSEFMLQQTQVSRVRDHFTRWIERFPDTFSLAAASRRDVLLAWSGMGYNRRALNLHEAVRRIVSQHGGAVPHDTALLEALPGIGRYTAAAVACFGHRRRMAVVDVNIRRVFSRLAGRMSDTAEMLPERVAWDIAAELLPSRAWYDWNQGLMDFGAMICTARDPDCGHCPLRELCPSAGLPSPARTSATSAAVREAPRRIYRGRVVEQLRQAARHCLTAQQLGTRLYDTDDIRREHLLDVLQSLARDGMIRARSGRKDVQALCDFAGELQKLRICLIE